MLTRFCLQNFITLFIFVATQTFFGYREYFVIEAFDLDPSLPSDNLTEELELYPSFKAKLNKLNLASYVLSIFLVIIVSRCGPPARTQRFHAPPHAPRCLRSNFILSCILILGNYSAGKTSITGLISSALLVAPRCLAWYLCVPPSCHASSPVTHAPVPVPGARSRATSAAFPSASSASCLRWPTPSTQTGASRTRCTAPAAAGRRRTGPRRMSCTRHEAAAAPRFRSDVLLETRLGLG